MKYIVCILVIIALVMSGCQKQPNEPVDQTPRPMPTMTQTLQPTPSVTPVSEQTDIAKLLPDQVGYEWIYNGFVEYDHEMILDAIEPNENGSVYRISGMVGDSSGGESTQDHNLNITYTLFSGVWVQEAVGPMLMDSDFGSIEILREPLEVGAQWTQQVTDSDNQTMTLVCTIDAVTEDEQGKVYKVLYQQDGGEYYEHRSIGEGRGVLSFEKLYAPQDGESFPIGYQIFYPSDQASAQDYSNQMNKWLPALGKQQRYFGLAEYGHTGMLSLDWEKDHETVYLYEGVYNDGVGTTDPFTIRYFIDYKRGTVTEQVLTNQRTGQPEVNSKIHHLVALMFPLESGKTWSWDAMWDEQRVLVKAEILELTEDLVKVKYSVAGMTGYYNDTYFEERTYEAGYGMTGFSMLVPGELNITAEDAEDPTKLRDALVNQLMFGYSQDKDWVAAGIG